MLAEDIKQASDNIEHHQRDTNRRDHYMCGSYLQPVMASHTGHIIFNQHLQCILFVKCFVLACLKGQP